MGQETGKPIDKEVAQHDAHVAGRTIVRVVVREEQILAEMPHLPHHAQIILPHLTLRGQACTEWTNWRLDNTDCTPTCAPSLAEASCRLKG